MRRTLKLLTAAAIVTAPSLAVGAPGGSGGPHTPSPTTAPGQGQFQGQGYNHMHTQAQAKGQPNQDCEALGTTPPSDSNGPGVRAYPDGSLRTPDGKFASAAGMPAPC